MSENTPKLDLLMKDPVLDGHEYFNVKTMMNDNWEKIDAFAETVDGEVKELQQRLDTEQRKEITLQPGLQIIESDKTVPFRLTGLKGRTLVNLLGRDGNCENINRFTPTRAVLTADITVKTQGTQSLKITSTGLPTGAAATGQSFSVKAGSYYILVGDVKLGSGTYAGPHVSGISNTKNNGNATDTTNFSTVWRAYSALSNAATVSLVSEVAGPVGSVAYFDAIRFYEITAAEYAALDSMSAEQVAAKYPYVDSVKPVRNPYVIQCGENLLPSFYEWGYTSASAGKVIAPNILSIDSTIVGPNLNAWVPVRVIRNTEYTLSVSHNGMIGVYDENQNTPLAEYSSAQEVTFNSGSREMIHVFFRAVAINTGLYLFTNPMVNIGNRALPFTPHENSMLALQTDLYADPLTGANADSVFERDGQYFKAKSWVRDVLSSAQGWEVAALYTGFKGVRYQHNMSAKQRSSIGAKFDGKILSEYGGVQAPDKITIDATHVYVFIPNADSGWGDNYNPSQDEIKAYFMGWRMRDQITTAPYNGGVKAWGSIMSGGADYYTNTLPATVAPDYKTPYELVYQLATPTVEPIVSEGQLTLNEGNNQVEVGTGIVLRERANPKYSPLSGGYYHINYNLTDFGLTGSQLTKQTKSILNVFRGSTKDSWATLSTSANGLSRVQIPVGRYDPSAAYSVTYLMLDTSPVAAFIGSVADNEKSLLADLVEDMQHASARVSVLENKKAEKDSPAWIAPTLLNGWVNVGGVDSTVGYFKDSLGFVHIRGFVRGGTGVIFRLPVGYRPVLQQNYATVGNNGATDQICRVGVNSVGQVILAVGTGNLFLSLDSIVPFQAEQ
ncbi:hypothetical protein D3C74_118140 [compost metagenome]